MWIDEFRFRYDDPACYGLELPPRGDSESSSSMVRRTLLGNALRLIPEFFPSLCAEVETVEDTLALDAPVEAFVYSSAERQAACVYDESREVPVVLLSSGIIELLTPAELRFVLGHEIGHFLFQHHHYPHPDAAENLAHRVNLAELGRAAEITADRVGFLCSQSVEITLKAMLKAATGLSERHMRFDVAAYLSQAREFLSSGGSGDMVFATHPMVPVRVRALLWFSMSSLYAEWTGEADSRAMSRDTLDHRVKKDLDSSGGGSLDPWRNEALRRAELWAVLLLTSADSLLTKEEQILLQRLFGPETAANAVAFVREHGLGAVEARFEDAIRAVALHPADMRAELYHRLRRFRDLLPPDDQTLCRVMTMIRDRLGVST